MRWADGNPSRSLLARKFWGLARTFSRKWGAPLLVHQDVSPAQNESKGPSLHRRDPILGKSDPFQPPPRRPSSQRSWGRDFRPRGLPSYPDRLLCMPFSLPRWTGLGARVGTSLSMQPSHFRGPLKPCSRYGLQSCSPTLYVCGTSRRGKKPGDCVSQKCRRCNVAGRDWKA